MWLTVAGSIGNDSWEPCGTVLQLPDGKRVTSSREGLITLPLEAVPPTTVMVPPGDAPDLYTSLCPPPPLVRDVDLSEIRDPQLSDGVWSPRMLGFYTASPLIVDLDPSKFACGAYTGCSVPASWAYALPQTGDDSLGQPVALDCVSCQALRHIRQTVSSSACFHQGSNAIELPCSR